jgi:thiamine biosynthesis lipoprotein
MLSLRPGQAYLAPGTGVDLGGIAKGWMADRLCAAMGGNLLANLGGDLFAAGTGPDGEGWPIDLAGTTVLLQDQGAATSSVRKRAWGAGLHHLIDPRTGRPAASDLAQVSVVAANAAEAEVSAKTALLLGSGQAREFLAARGLAWWMEAA